MLSISSQNVWPPYWIFKAEEGGGVKEIYTIGVVDRLEQEGERCRGRRLLSPLSHSLPAHFFPTLHPKQTKQAWQLGK